MGLDLSCKVFVTTLDVELFDILFMNEIRKICIT